MENRPETNQAVAPGKAEEGTAQSTASEESQLATQPSDDAKDKNESAPTTAALNTNLHQEQKEEDPDEDVCKADETRTEEVQAIAESKSATKQVSATANRQNETRQESKVAQSSAGTQNSDRPMFMTNDNFGCPDHVLKKIVADEYNLEKTKKDNITQLRSKHLLAWSTESATKTQSNRLMLWA